MLLVIIFIVILVEILFIKRVISNLALKLLWKLRKGKAIKSWIIKAIEYSTVIILVSVITYILIGNSFNSNFDITKWIISNNREIIFVSATIFITYHVALLIVLICSHKNCNEYMGIATASDDEKLK